VSDRYTYDHLYFEDYYVSSLKLGQPLFVVRYFKGISKI
jgi:hypothetical protein